MQKNIYYIFYAVPLLLTPYSSSVVSPNQSTIPCYTLYLVLMPSNCCFQYSICSFLSLL